MKKILMTTVAASFLFAAEANASNLCIGLINYSSEIVEFLTETHPRTIPHVQPGHKFVLPADFMVSCSHDLCTVYIRGTETNNYKFLHRVPLGTQIVLGYNLDYYLDTKAEVPCKGSN